MKLSPVLFWDTDPAGIDWERHARYVIARVVMYGTLQDWHTIRLHYGMNRIREEMLHETALDPKSLAMLSNLFQLPYSDFACYTRIQSAPGHWSY